MRFDYAHPNRNIDTSTTGEVHLTAEVEATFKAAVHPSRNQMHAHEYAPSANALPIYQAICPVDRKDAIGK